MIKNFRSEVAGYIRKNPTLILFSLAGTLFLTVLLHQDSESARKFLEPALYGFLLGLPVCLGADYLSEGRKISREFLPAALAAVFIFGYLLSYYLGYLPCLQVHVAFAAYLLLLLTPPAVRRDESVGFHWLIFVLYALGLSISISSMLLGLLAFLLWVIKELFAWELPKLIEKLGLATLCIFLPVNLFAHFKPEAAKVAALRYSLAGLVERVVRLLFIPVMIVYQVVLLIYSLKIWIVLELPQGMVSKPIAVAYMIFFSINSYLESQGRSDDGIWRYRRLFNFAFAPLFIMMLVGIVKRISDYGFTPDRVYLVLIFTVMVFSWLLRLIYNKTEIRKVIALGALLLLITSMGPLSPSAISVQSQSSRFLSLLQKYRDSYQTLSELKLSDWERLDIEQASSALQVIVGFKAVDVLEKKGLEKGVFIKGPNEEKMSFRIVPDIEDQLFRMSRARANGKARYSNGKSSCRIFNVYHEYRERSFIVSGYDYLMELSEGHRTIQGTKDSVHVDMRAGRVFIFEDGKEEELIFDYGAKVREQADILGADSAARPIEMEGTAGHYKVKMQIIYAALDCEESSFSAVLYIKSL